MFTYIYLALFGKIRLWIACGQSKYKQNGHPWLEENTVTLWQQELFMLENEIYFVKIELLSGDVFLLNKVIVHWKNSFNIQRMVSFF